MQSTAGKRIPALLLSQALIGTGLQDISRSLQVNKLFRQPFTADPFPPFSISLHMLQSIHAGRATLTNASVGTNHQHGKVWAVAGEAKDGCFQILVVASQVNESDHFGRTLTDLFCCPGVTVIYHLRNIRSL